MQGRNRDTDIEDGYMDTEREGEGGTNSRVTVTHIHYHVENRQLLKGSC